MYNWVVTDANQMGIQFNLTGDVMKPVLVNKNLVSVPTEGAHGYDANRFQPTTRKPLVANCCRQ